MTFDFKKYSPKYNSLFEEMRKKILALVKSKIVIEHIGSTSVSGLGGKGIIDISIGIKSWTQTSEILKALRKIGFKHFHDVENHSIFVSSKEKCEEGDFHVHISRFGTKRYNRTLAFRDLMRQDKSEASRYAKLKEELFEKCHGDRQLYKESKRNYIDSLPGQN